MSSVPRILGLLFVLAPASCAAPCDDDGLRQHCDVRQIELTTGVADSSGSSGVAVPVDDSSSGEPPGTSDGGSSGGLASSSGAGDLDTTSTGADESSGTTGVVVDDPVDLSGWVVVQTASSRELELPPGTIVPRGGALVIGRDADQAAFEAFWQVTLGDDVTYLDGLDGMPVINGDETFAIVDDLDLTIDGPTPALFESTLLVRTDADLDAADPLAWSESVDPNAEAVPGQAVAAGGESGVPYIAAVADPVGVDAYVFEYVEIRVAP